MTRVGSRFVTVAAVAAASAAMTACGNEAHEPAATPPPGSPQNPLVAKATPADEPTAAPTTGTTGRAHPPGTPTHGRIARSGRRAHPTGHADADAGGSEGDGQARAGQRAAEAPAGVCRLVSEAEAQAIFGKPVQLPVEAKQGPTCIYRTRAGDQFLTLALQRADLRAVTQHLRDRRTVSVSSRTGYCGSAGQPMLYVPIRPHRVLAISGRCSIARLFAAHAVPRLAG